MNSYQLVKIGLTFFKKYIMHQKILGGGNRGGNVGRKDGGYKGCSWGR